MILLDILGEIEVCKFNWFELRQLVTTGKTKKRQFKNLGYYYRYYEDAARSF